jgi:cytosine/adenosine deaminase-related metal-dependent hydrolase
LIRERYGETPVGHLHRLGFLGPDVILGHCIYVSGHPDIGGDPDRDLALIAAAGSSVAHSPLPFARMGEALHTLPRYLDHGITVGIGCDIWPADIIAEMRLAWVLGKQTNRTAERPTCHEVFTAATVGSADALGRADLGRLAAGALADIVCVDLGRYHFGPILDPVRALVTCGTGKTSTPSTWTGRRSSPGAGRGTPTKRPCGSRRRASWPACSGPPPSGTRSGGPPPRCSRRDDDRWAARWGGGAGRGRRCGWR